MVIFSVHPRFLYITHRSLARTLTWNVFTISAWFYFSNTYVYRVLLFFVLGKLCELISISLVNFLSCRFLKNPVDFILGIYSYK